VGEEGETTGSSVFAHFAVCGGCGSAGGQGFRQKRVSRKDHSKYKAKTGVLVAATAAAVVRFAEKIPL
jgi:hypothetical protein